MIILRRVIYKSHNIKTSLGVAFNSFFEGTAVPKIMSVLISLVPEYEITKPYHSNEGASSCPTRCTCDTRATYTKARLCSTRWTYLATRCIWNYRKHAVRKKGCRAWRKDEENERNNNNHSNKNKQINRLTNSDIYLHLTAKTLS